MSATSEQAWSAWPYVVGQKKDEPVHELKKSMQEFVADVKAKQAAQLKLLVPRRS